MQDYYEPKVGEKAPAFKLPSSEGKPISLKDYKGKHVILYFYPRDNTPGCTAEACSFRDNMSALTSTNAVVLGVSTDSLESHDKFRSKHELNFPLLSDETADVARMYGAWGEKNMYGKRIWGIKRMTYWIGPDQKIRKIWKKVDTKTHGEDVLKEVKG